MLSKHWRFAETFSSVLNISMTEGVFPNQLKFAKVCPIHKSGSKTDTANYRPISLLPVFSKIFEKAIHRRLTEFLDTNNSLYNYQFGFRKQHSCEHALLAAQKSILEALDKKQIAMLLLIDFSKAFDMDSFTVTGTLFTAKNEQNLGRMTKSLIWLGLLFSNLIKF